MKLFIDTANLDAIRRVADLGLLDGVTTNPTLVSREKMPADKLYDEIAKICQGPVNVEAVSQDADGIVEEARTFQKRAPNFVTKIPCFEEGLKAVRRLADEGAHVVVADINLTGAQETADAIAAATGRRTLAARADVTREDDVAAMVDSESEYSIGPTWYQFLFTGTIVENLCPGRTISGKEINT